MAKQHTSVFLVARDVRLGDGKMLRDVPCSRPIHRLGTLRRVMKRVQRRLPDAFAVERSVYRQL